LNDRDRRRARPEGDRPRTTGADLVLTLHPSLLTAGHILSIRTPESPVWSADGRWLAWRVAGFEVGEVWAGSVAAPQTARRLADGGAPRWADDALLFMRGGALWRVGLDGREELVLALAEGATRPVILPRGDGVACIREGDVWLHEVGEAAPRRLTRCELLMTRPYHVLRELVVPSPDGRRIAIVAPREQSADLGVYDRERDTLEWVGVTPETEIRPVWSPDGRRLAFTRHARSVEWRELWVWTADSGALTRLWRDEDTRSVVRAEFDVSFSPDPSPGSGQAQQVAFVAPVDGFGQVLVAPVSGGEPRRVSRSGECGQPAWSPDGRSLAWVANLTGSPGWHEHHLFVIDSAGGEPERVTSGPCLVESFRWSTDGRRLAIVSSTPDAPNRLLAYDRDTGVTHLMHDHGPADLPVSDVDVSFNTIPSEDGRWQIPTMVFSRRDLPANGSAPGLVYAHGGGMGQYALAGWGSYTDKGTIYATCVMLAQRGYVTALPDYRGSYGYGREYELASYLDVGGGDMRDIVATGRWLAAQPEVDAERLGLWGRSFGGFLTLQTMTREPELFQAGVNLVGVFDWLAYDAFTTDLFPGSWIRARFKDPVAHREHYLNASPLTWIEYLARPVLTLHGTADANVPLDEAYGLTRALLEAGKEFEMVIYPDEPHIFTRASTWRDALARMTRFFDRSVRGIAD
jgi:dipeptidyl aminopeptidase/acylaminoacyl peptidase